ncbi:hypothetical protein M5X17_31230 [Paenibacillus alvei]|uniref:hypothetical protein n=1 Tax=Paenibacillus alvei TaxID=44250 RepID=UPI00227F842C|nr:hypothetical protein [Paenibacillus alvei]MCY9738167.1 hypothetical protein [Paenibacillus alvei]
MLQMNFKTAQKRLIYEGRLRIMYRGDDYWTDHRYCEICGRAKRHGEITLDFTSDKMICNECEEIKIEDKKEINS